MQAAFGLICPAALAFSVQGCSASCDDRADWDPTVQVTDAATQQPICGGTVTVAQTGEVITVAAHADGYCNGTVTVGESGHDYTVAVDAPGYQSRTVEVRAEHRGCHDDGGRVVVQLEPTP